MSQDKLKITPEARAILTQQIKLMLGPDADPDAVERAVEESLKKLPSQSELARMEQDLIKKFPNLGQFIKPRGT